MKASLSESHRLLFGPYKAPRCRVGAALDCEARGCTVIVAGLHDAPISWPYAKKRGNRSLILCGDLIKAVALEAASAVAYHWGVSATTVWTWRRALGVPAHTLGSLRLMRHYRAIGRERSRSPQSRAKMGARRAGKPPHPRFKAAALAAARRPKSEAWKRALSERLRREWASGVRRNPFGKAAQTQHPAGGAKRPAGSGNQKPRERSKRRT